ncbi:blastula protease 10-like [Littorina saxatilis]|uniref:blastula protease 10-like n=1 Tax=Littorina saxatilis TaxID=31220 RepID=UPI0038B5B446
MSFLLIAFVCLLLHLPPAHSVHIKHSARLDTRLWRTLLGQRLAGYRKPAEEAGVEGAFESDMRLTSQQMTDILHQQQQNQQASLGASLLPAGVGGEGGGRGGRLKRKAVAHHSYLWPSRTVPYVFQHDFPEPYRETVLEAMQFWQRSTCVKFVPFSQSITEYLRHADYVLFRVGEGCQSSIGRVGLGEQTTEIASHCNEFGSVAHELGHILGFYHEQSRPDRDNHVTILRENIRSGRQHNFLKYSTSEIVTEEPYDIGSVMHYGPTYFSRDGGSRTIDTQDESYRAVMGQRNAPSFIDVKTANDMYTCNAQCDVWPECDNMGYVGPDCTCMCPTGLGGYDCTEVKSSTGDCGGVLKSTSGTIESPGYGNGNVYDSNIDCLWLIQGPFDTRSISLKMDGFELEDDTIQPCAFDWLEVRSLGPHLNGQRFCGEGPSDGVVYHGNTLVIHFHSDDSYTFSGFRLHYDVTKTSQSQPAMAHDDGLHGLDSHYAYTVPQSPAPEAKTASPEYHSPPQEAKAAQHTTEDPPQYHVPEAADFTTDAAASSDQVPSYSVETGGSLTHWTEWSPCSRLCDGGQRSRIRACRVAYCYDNQFEERPCNTHPCDVTDLGSGYDYYSEEE